jgi:hypothetical protein
MVQAMAINWLENTTIIIILMLFCFYMATNRGHSFVSLFNQKADMFFVTVLKNGLVFCD